MRSAKSNLAYFASIDALKVNLASCPWSCPLIKCRNKFMITFLPKPSYLVDSFALIYMPPLLKTKLCVSYWDRSSPLRVNLLELDVTSNMMNMLMLFF